VAQAKNGEVRFFLKADENYEKVLKYPVSSRNVTCGVPT